MPKVTPSPAARGRLGGLTTAARYGGLAITQAARDTYRASFLDGHACAVCPLVTIDPELPLPERRVRAERLRRLHFTRLASRSVQARAS
jgi:hypothetical protein